MRHGIVSCALATLLTGAAVAPANLELGISVTPSAAGVASGGAFSELATVGQSGVGALSGTGLVAVAGFHGLDTFPPVMVCQAITVHLVEGEATITPEDVSADFYDNSGYLELLLDRDTFTTDDIGEVEVTVTGTDWIGFSVSCAVIITITDEAPPPSWWLFQ